MTSIEGKLTVWVKGGEFDFNDDLYIQFCLDDRRVWKTEETDSKKPSWDAKMTKHIKGEFTSFEFRLMDKDSFSRDDHLGTAKIAVSSLLSPSFSKVERVSLDGDCEMFDASNDKIGTLRIGIEYCPGDVGFFHSMADRFHT